jgi:hypothetical protein
MKLLSLVNHTAITLCSPQNFLKTDPSTAAMLECLHRWEVNDMASQRVEDMHEEAGLIMRNKHALWGLRGSGHHYVVAKHL